MQNVDNYGIHWDKGTAWLVQGRGGSNFVGLRDRCPFRASGGMCNHLIPTAAPLPDPIHWESFLRFFNDPLVQAMLPIPHDFGQNLFYVEDPYDDLGLYLATLTRLSSPINQVVRPMWMVKMKDLERELRATNIQPFLMVQASQKNQEMLDTLSRVVKYSPRTVVVTGQEEVVAAPPFQRIKTDIRKFNLSDLMTLPLENIGAAILRRYSRREELGAPMESRVDRRNRQIQERAKRQ